MNYGVILASGKGTRVKDNINIPKQFRELNGIPIIVYTIRKFLDTSSFDYIFIAVSEEYFKSIEQIIDKYFDEEESKKIVVTMGGKERIDSIINVINRIQKVNVIGEDDVVVIHDAVRPFVSNKILLDNINNARKYGAVVTSAPVTDTLLISSSGNVVDEIPKRSLYYKGQSPDSFKLRLFIDLLSKLSNEDKSIMTGTSQVCTLNDYPIYMVEGDELNFKITTSSDFIIAEAIAREEVKKCLQLKKFL